MNIESIKEKVFKNSLGTCEYVDGYVNASSTIMVRCIKHNKYFQTKWENVRRDNRAHLICKECQEEAKQLSLQTNRTLVKCAYCGKEFYKPNSKLENSKSGLYFCCREHKDLAQRLDSGEEFQTMRPEHYGEITTKYRELAFRNYEHKCAVCGYAEDEDLLEVHHINENHSDNELSNLIILCPLCHRKLTSHKYKLINNKIIAVAR